MVKGFRGLLGRENSKEILRAAVGLGAGADFRQLPAHEREARAKDVPTLGSGRIFPVAEEDISVDAFQIPAHWVQIVGLDFGWDHPAAAAWKPVLDMLERMQTGRFKVFRRLTDFFEEFRLYHRKDGKIVKEMDDLICAVWYAVMMKPLAIDKPKHVVSRRRGSPMAV